MTYDFNELNTNAGGGGVQGPFLNWQARRGAHSEAESWALRTKDDDGGSQIHDVSANMQQGVIFDYNTLQLGWEKWAPLGQPNETKWAPTPNLAAFPRPDDSKRANEMGRETFWWQKVFAIRVALTLDLACTWTQSQFGAMLGFEGFVDQLKAAGPQHPGKLPLVRWTGVREDFGGAKVPVLEIADWKDAPACLAQDTGAGNISTGPAAAAPAAAPAPAPAPAAAPAPQPAAPAANTIPAGAQF